MRKVLIGILLVVLLAIFAGMVISGIDIGSTSIGYSVQNIIDKNYELDNDIVSLETKITQEYGAAKTELDSSFKKLQTEKQSYQDTITYTSEEDIQAANQTEEYKLDYLWTNIGLYATKNNVTMKADLTYGSSGVPNQYNISFTAMGEYLSLSEFVYAIEKDPNLGFRIEEFALVPYSEEQLQASFIIKNVSIDPTSLSQSGLSSGSSSDSKDSNNTSANNTTDTNTTNTANTTGGTNTTNTANTANGANTTNNNSGS